MRNADVSMDTTVSHWDMSLRRWHCSGLRDPPPVPPDSSVDVSVVNVPRTTLDAPDWALSTSGPRRDWGYCGPLAPGCEKGGLRMGRVEMPNGFEPTQIGSDFVLGTATDSDGVEYVRMYRLIRR